MDWQAALSDPSIIICSKDTRLGYLLSEMFTSDGLAVTCHGKLTKFGKHLEKSVQDHPKTCKISKLRAGVILVVLHV